MAYWLFKSEPTSYSIDDLKKEKVGMWDGVRNYQARNFLRDEVKKGDLVLIYHSNASIIGIVGVATVVKEAYPDPTQFDPKEDHYDPTVKKENPRWFVVDVKFKMKFIKPVTLHQLKNDPYFNDMMLTQKGMRLSVMPVKEKHYKQIMKMAT